MIIWKWAFIHFHFQFDIDFYHCWIKKNERIKIVCFWLLGNCFHEWMDFYGGFLIFYTWHHVSVLIQALILLCVELDWKLLLKAVRKFLRNGLRLVIHTFIFELKWVHHLYILKPKQFLCKSKLKNPWIEYTKNQKLNRLRNIPN